MAESLVRFLVILNPFALCLYLTGIMDELPVRDFIVVVLRASAISLVAFWIAAVGGERLLTGWLGIRPEALRVFGGAIFFVVAYNYVIKGWRAANVLRGSLEELPSAIALPFMIGAGTITEAILIGKRTHPLQALAMLAAAMAAAVAVILLFLLFRSHMRQRNEQIFERYVNILVRVNGLVIGAFSIDMAVTGVHDLWFATPLP